MDSNNTPRHPDQGASRGRPILGKSHGPPDPAPPITQGSELNFNAAEFVPRFRQPQVTMPVPQQPQFEFEAQKSAKDQVSQAVQILTEEPAMFDDLKLHLSTALSQSITLEHHLTDVIEEIFTEGVTHANFRYTAARLCNNLSHNLTLNFDATFRSRLLNRCRCEHLQRQHLPAGRLTGFTLFMAELLANLEDGSGGRITRLAEALLELLETLLSSTGSERVSSLRCVVQVLKLAGGYIDDIIPEKMAQFIGVIKSLILDGELPRNLRSMFLSVVELRASGWGRESEASTSTAPSSTSLPPPSSNANFQPPTQSNHHVNGSSITNTQATDHWNYVTAPAYDGVFYTDQPEPNMDGGDVMPINELDEAEFFDYLMGPEGDYQPYSVDEEFDEEIANAFEQFMLETEQK